MSGEPSNFNARAMARWLASRGRPHAKRQAAGATSNACGASAQPLPLIVTRCRDEAAGSSEGIAKERLVRDRLSTRVDRPSWMLERRPLCPHLVPCSDSEMPPGACCYGPWPLALHALRVSRLPSRSVTTSTGSVGQILYRGGRLCGGALMASR